MNKADCGRWVNRSSCFMAECLVAYECQFSDYDKETNEAFFEAVEKSVSVRPRILDDDGRVQLCEQCNGEDGKAVEIGIGSLTVSMVWAHNAFDSGVCRMVYICSTCFRAMVTAENANNAWFDAWTYGADKDCPACLAEIPRNL